MNIVLPFDPIASFPNQQNLGTESARLENDNSNAIPETSQVEQSTLSNDENASEGQTSSHHSGEQVILSEQAIALSKEEQGSDKLALSEEEQKQVQELKDRDREVKVHEQAHAAVGGQYAGAPSYEYETGPDGKRYAVGGEVSIDVSEEEKPEETVQKMQIVRAAALAPAEPSTQDLKVAAEASQKENQARAQMSQQQLDGSSKNASDTNKPSPESVEDTTSNTQTLSQKRITNAYLSSIEQISNTFGTKA